MHHYSQGKHTKQAHKAIPEKHFEEEQGRKGFFGAVSHLIRKRPSTRWTKIEGNLRPHMYDLVKMQIPVGQWQRLLYNSDITIYNYWDEPGSESTQQGFRNADGDTLYFCHKGSGNIVTEYGLLSFRQGSYIVMPRCVVHTFDFEEPTQFLVIESKTSSFEEPNRGMVGRNAVYDQETLGKPDLAARDAFIAEKKLNVCIIKVKRFDEVTRFYYNDCIYDTIGWKGDFFPFTLHMDDISPLMSHRVHLPPSAHTTFVARGFVVCSFLPRPLEEDEDALKVPFYHQNIDYDEVLFYHAGDFFSRDNLHAGMMSFHPQGFPHGPHPKAVKNVGNKKRTDEYAVMIDSWQALKVDESLLGVELKDYWKSWME